MMSSVPRQSLYAYTFFLERPKQHVTTCKVLARDRDAAERKARVAYGSDKDLTLHLDYIEEIRAL